MNSFALHSFFQAARGLPLDIIKGNRGVEMLAEVLHSSSVQRLRGILMNRYGKGLKVNFMMDVTSIDLTLQSPCFKQGELRIPIIGDDKYLATAIIPEAENISNEVAQQMADLVQMILVPTMLDWHSQQTERNAYKITDQSAFPGIEINAPAFILESKTGKALTKVAIQIHEISERWAFLNYKDIKNGIQSAQDIKDLGAMTVLIDDIEDLNKEEQLFLAEYLVEAQNKSEPLFLVGSSKSLNELSAKGQIVSSLALILQDNRLELDRLPQEFNQLKETLELFLDRHAMLN